MDHTLYFGRSTTPYTIKGVLLDFHEHAYTETIRPLLILLLSRDFLLLILDSFLIASPLAWLFFKKWLQEFAYRIGIEWWVFAGAGLGAVAVAMLTVGYQAMKAARVNPATTLRAE